ncbi:cytochrome o ubiquinol oxidase subunit I, partial [Brevundimonas sp. NPDC049575]
MSTDQIASMIFGRLTWDALPFHEPILVVTFAVVVLGGLATLALITRYKLWGYLWTEWFTTVDHKKIGIMYMILGLVMFLRGFADASEIREGRERAASALQGGLAVRRAGLT